MGSDEPQWHFATFFFFFLSPSSFTPQALL